jgi:hypothetical protein
MSGTVTDPAICLAIQAQRRTRIPMVRFNPISPYSNIATGLSTNITTEQLNMRRKAEILKYESNRMPNQTNNLTKNQKWSRLVTQPTRDRPYANDFNPDNCPTNVPISSTASGVPGPPVMLYEDPNIPLYNFIVNRSYAYNVPNENNYWEITVNTNVGLYSGVADSVFSLNILPSINRPQYTYGMSIPIGLHAEGIHTGTFPWLPNSVSDTNTLVAITIKTASLIVYCNNKDITKQLTGSPTLIKTINKNLTVNIPYRQGQTFNVTQSIDNVTFSGITLFTSYIYTFDFKLKLDLDIRINGVEISNIPSDVTESLTVYAYANMTNMNPIMAVNCSVTAPNPSIPLYPPTLFG